MAYTAVGTILNAPNGTNSSSTASLTTSNVGDLVVAFLDGTATTQTVTGLSSSHVTWSQIGSSLGFNSNESAQMWWGVVTAVATAAVTITWSSASSGSNSVCWSFIQFSSGLGSSTVWTVDTSGSSVVSTATTAMTCPTLAPTSGTELYVGYMCSGATGAAGSTSGCVYQTNPYSDQIVYDLACSASLTPAATQSPAAGYAKFGALFKGALPVTPPPPQPIRVMRQAAKLSANY